MPAEHIPVLKQEIVDYAPLYTHTILDCTIGGGGHSLALLHQFPSAQLVALDRDAQTLESVRNLFAHVSVPPILYHTRFSELQEILGSQSWKFDYVLADIGVSSFQLDQPERGFSFVHDGPLDMRMDASDSIPNAAWWVNQSSEKELAEIFQQYGEERFASKIANGIIKIRETTPFCSTLQLADCVKSLIPRRFHKKNFHPATLVFQALRIVVNEELDELQALLKTVINYLNTGGRLAFISFHSLEDRIIKQQFQQWENPCQCPRDLPQCICGLSALGKRVIKRPIYPSQEEIKNNLRSRSAKLRLFEKNEEIDKRDP